VIPAAWTTDDPRGERLLFVAPTEDFRHGHARDLPSFLRAEDLVVVNDSATLPASLAGTAVEGALEVRLLAEQPRSDAPVWSALLFGPGDFRIRTEDRPPPPSLRVGAAIRFAPEFSAVVERIDSRWKNRVVDLRFEGNRTRFWANLYRHGRPIQYAHTARRFELWDVQNAYASRPWSIEPPSAGRLLRASTMKALSERHVGLATLTHAAGLSSTGDPELDALLPLRERYEIPQATAAAIDETRRKGGRIVAVGTTVMRALESAADAEGGVRAGAGTTDLLITAAHQRRIVDALLTGIHEGGTSHFRMLESFMDRAALARALGAAEAAGYRSHELGDAMLVFG
jgi:S-adenosylmethionine:tRNA ribosyltransferase-isomerase